LKPNQLSGGLVSAVEPDTLADQMGLQAGDVILAVNDHPLRDVIDFRFYAAEEEIELTVQRDGRELTLSGVRRYDQPVGVEFAHPTFDVDIRRCNNKCEFCFVTQSPRGMRRTVYIKDDDYRYSFLFGHFVTLTNLGDEDWERIEEQHLSPLYVSVHATDPDARRAMLINPRAALIEEHLDRLSAGGIRAHAQVVLCPGINDGEVLERTIRDLYARGDDVLSLSIVPVGLTEFNSDRGVRPLTRQECVEALTAIDAVRTLALRDRGRGWCYAADEMFLQAGLDLPESSYFDDHELVANGVGAVSALSASIRGDLDDLPRLSGKRILLVTGTSMLPYLEDLADEISTKTGASLHTTATTSTLYGPMVTTAGLLAGADHIRAIEPFRDFDLALFSRSALNDQDMFLDDLSLEDLGQVFPELRICPSEHVTDTLLTL